MNGQEIIKLVGKPLENLKVQAMLQYFGYQEPEKGYYAGHIYGEKISIMFESKIGFDHTYTDPPYEFSYDNDYIDVPFENPDLPQLKFIVSEIRFSTKFKGKLPFDLSWNHSLKEVAKLGTLHKKSTNSEGAIIREFLRDQYEIQLYFKEDKLYYVTVWWINNGIKKSIERKNTIQFQNKNINPENVSKVKSFITKKPTIEWYKNLLEKEPFYTQESIDQTDEVLNAFIHNLVIATQEKKANKVLSSVKKVILSLNKLEQKFGHIESIERDVLCPFILDATQSTGFEVESDITEEWRTW